MKLLCFLLVLGVYLNAMVFNEKGEPKKALLTILDTLYLPYKPHDTSVFETTKVLLRKEGVERKDITEKNLTYEQKTAIYAALSELGFIQEVRPSVLEYDDILIMGGYADEMRCRMEYLINLYHKGLRFKRIFFLTGHRKRDQSHETDHIIFFKNKAARVSTVVQTEVDIMKLIWSQIDKPQELESVETFVVDVGVKALAKGKKSLPNTYDTLKALMDGPYNLSGRTYLAISSQPYIAYQEALLKRVLPSSYQGMTAGPVPPKNILFAQYLDILARTVHNEFWCRHPETPAIN